MYFMNTLKPRPLWTSGPADGQWGWLFDGHTVMERESCGVVHSRRPLQVGSSIVLRKALQ
jgi:hypothetical protein